MKYTDYDIDDFLTDEFFIQWVKQPNENNRHCCEKWLDQHREQREALMQAVRRISSLHQQDKPAMADRLYVEVLENILKAEKDVKSLPSNTPVWNFSFPWRGMVASLLMLFCLGMVYHLLTAPPIDEEVIPNEPFLISKSNPAGEKSILT